MQLNKENFGGQIKAKYRGFKDNEKVQTTSAKIEAFEKKHLNIPKTLISVPIIAGGLTMGYYHIPFSSDVLIFGLSSFVIGLGFKANRKLLNKEAANKVEQVLLNILKRAIKR